MFFVAVGLWFHCYGNLNFPLAYNGKGHLLLSHYRYFDKRFTEISREYTSYKHLDFVGISQY